ncbi:MAG: nucleotidyl transferase AbiEii/AbiGii toxin family protein [bacterium]|nr:nucleotidyl transferase AbiEii/AbiGii toxin family protein [bacterium]
MPKIQLTKLQQDILSFFGRNSFGRNFYWTGGTALSYQYFHHRDSVDLDFFSDDLFADDEYLIFIKDLKKALGLEKVTLTKQFNRRLYLASRQAENVKLEQVFFPFSAIEKRGNMPEFSLAIDSLTDVMVNKTLSIYQRNEVKDIFDLYFYFNQRPKYNLNRLIALVEQKFGVAIEPTLLLSKINELAQNIDLLKPLLFNPEKNLTQKVKSFFQNYFNSLAKNKLA